MKKLLGLTVLAMVLALTACGNGDSGNAGGSAETACVMDLGILGTIAVVAQSEDDEITSIVIQMRTDVSELDEEIVESLLAEEETAERDGDYLVVTSGEGTPEELGFPTSLEEFIAEAERDGATCN